MNIVLDTHPVNQAYDLQSQIFKVLTHPARIAILEILRDGEHCVCHMEAHLGFRQAYISQQLSVLREAMLVQDRRDGWNIFYRVVNPQIYDVLDAAQKMIEKDPSNGNSPSLPRMDVNQSKVTCTCPHCHTSPIP